jgi:hypothetical protein
MVGPAFLMPCTVAPETRERDANISIIRGKKAREINTRAAKHNLANVVLQDFRPTARGVIWTRETHMWNFKTSGWQLAVS